MCNKMFRSITISHNNVWAMFDHHDFWTTLPLAAAAAVCIVHNKSDNLYTFSGITGDKEQECEMLVTVVD